MNIESVLSKIRKFEDLVLDSGFKRDVDDYSQSITQTQNQNLVFMKGLSEKLKKELYKFENNSLESDLKSVLRKQTPFSPLQFLKELEEIDNNKEVNAQEYFNAFNTILNRLKKSIQLNENEIIEVKTVFQKYVTPQDNFESEEGQALISLIFSDLKSTKSLKEFSKVLNRWNGTLLIYHSLLKSKAPSEISLYEVQNGSIDVILNIDLDIAIELAEVFKVGLKVYGAYLLYKSKTAKTIIASYLGNEELIEGEKKREELMLNNVYESMKNKVLEQYEVRKTKDNKILNEAIPKKADHVAKVIADHIVKGNEVRLLTEIATQEDDGTEKNDITKEIQIESANVRKLTNDIDEDDRKLLLEKYTFDEDEDEDEDE
ncbi:MAG: hypothetical protein JJ958_02525 [Balneola sp.]|nr:hypothetical protein [Balneola sp.]